MSFSIEDREKGRRNLKVNGTARSQTMKIVQLIMSRQFRGAEVFAAQLSKELLLLGHEVRYAALYKTEGKEFIPEGILFDDLSAIKGGGINLALIKKLNKFLKTYQPDIVQANAGDTLKYAVLVKWLFGHSYKIVFRNASMVSQYLKTYPQKLFNSFLYHRTKYVISVSEKCKADIVSVYPFLQSKIKVIPIGVTARPFKRLKEFDNGKINLIHVGGFTFEKNHTGLLRIFDRIKNKVPNAVLWLVGDGPLLDKIKTEVKKSDWSESIIFTQAVANPLDYIHSAKLLLLPSHIEGLPGVLLESFLCRVPVVAYNVGGVSEVVVNGNTGWLIAKDHEDIFAEKVVEILANKELANKMVEQAFHVAIDQFDNRLIAQRFLKAYQQLN